MKEWSENKNFTVCFNCESNELSSILKFSPLVFLVVFSDVKDISSEYSGRIVLSTKLHTDAEYISVLFVKKFSLKKIHNLRLVSKITVWIRDLSYSLICNFPSKVFNSETVLPMIWKKCSRIRMSWINIYHKTFQVWIWHFTLIVELLKNACSFVVQ